MNFFKGYFWGLVFSLSFWFLFFWALSSCAAQAAELWVGANWTHVSQLDEGPPFNDRDEDSVDHIGVDLMLREQFQDDWEGYMSLSFGRNYNLTGCDCWDDGGAEVDTVLTFGLRKRLYTF